jgi:predicted nuclease of predicted toxin-antitoxin system
MRILADENIPRGVVAALRAIGHEVIWAVDIGRRAPDSEHLATALNDNLAILSEDADFARLASEATKEGLNAPAVVLIRLHGMSRNSKIDRTVRAIEEIGDQPSRDSVHVIEPTRLRKRLLRRDFL